MKTNRTLRACFALALVASSGLRAEEDEQDPSIAGLAKAASEFVAAYNDKDAAALAAFFIEDGEMLDLSGVDRLSGRDEIKAHYEEVFAAKNAPSMALEVNSVRLVAPNLAIEDGTVHLTPPGDNLPPRSTDYTAVLMKNDAGNWQIASTRSLADKTDAAGQLADLEEVIKGEWTCRNAEGLQMDFAFGWDPTGKFLAGEILTTSSDTDPDKGTMRIGWNAARRAIVSWIFDAEGGVMQGIWTPTDDGWLVRSEGTTADGETVTANQELTTEGKGTLIWSVSNRVVNGEKQPNVQLRLVRQVPEPSAN